MKRFLLTAAVAALAASSVANAQTRPPGSGVDRAQNNNGQGQQNFSDILAGDVAAGRLNQDQANRLQARSDQTRETLDRQAMEAGRRFAGTNQANYLQDEQRVIDTAGRGSGGSSGQAYASVDLLSQTLARETAFRGEVGTISQDAYRSASAILEERARMIAENPNSSEADRRDARRVADDANRILSRATDRINQDEVNARNARAFVDNNRDTIAGGMQAVIDRYGTDPSRWPPPDQMDLPGMRRPTPATPPAPPPAWSTTPPVPPAPPAPPARPAPSTPSRPPAAGSDPRGARVDPSNPDQYTRVQTRQPTEAERQAQQRAAQEAAQRAAAQQEAQRRAQQEAAARNRPPPPPPPPRIDPTRIPPTRLPPQTSPVAPSPPRPGTGGGTTGRGNVPVVNPNRPAVLGTPVPAGGGSGSGQGGGGTGRGPFEFRPIPGNALVEGEWDYLGDAAGGGPWSVGDSFAWADMLARMRLRMPEGSEAWRGFERGMPTTVAELEAIYEGWDINTAPPGSSGRSFSAVGNSPPMDWYLPGFGALSDELAFYDAMGWLFRSASEGGPRIEWGALDLANIGFLANGDGRPAPGSLAEFLRDNYYVNFPAFWDGALYVDMWQYDPIADRDRELARALYGPLWSDRPYRLTFDPTGRNNQFSPDSELAGFLGDLSFDDLLVYLLRGGTGGLDRLLAQPFNVLLTWGAGAFDVDLHMTGPTGLPDNSRFHIFYAATGALDRPPFAQLIRDCICRSGSEVILTTQLLQGGVYRISAFNFGNQSTTSTELSTNADLRLLIVRGGAAVSVGNGTTIQGGTVVFAGGPTAGRPGNTWVGVEIDPRTGQIRFVNRSDNSVNGDGTGNAALGAQSVAREPAMVVPRGPRESSSGPLQ